MTGKATNMAVLAAGAATILWSAAAPAQEAGDADAGWARVIQCAQLSGADARHNCIDQLLRDKGLLDQQRERAEARAAFGKEERATPAPKRPQAPARPAEPATAATPVAPAATTATAAAEPQSGGDQAASPADGVLNTQVKDARWAPDRKLLFTTVEGATWKQTESAEIRFLPRPGDKVTIERGALGSYICTILRSTVFRCRRID